MPHRLSELEIWKMGRLFCSEIYKLTSKFPDSEKFGITNQLRSAFVALPSNMSEGPSRSLNKDFNPFLEIIIGSKYPREIHLMIASALGLVKSEELNAAKKNLGSLIKMTSESNLP